MPPGLPYPAQRPKWDWRGARRWLQVHAIEQGLTECEAPFGAETTMRSAEGDNDAVHVLHRGSILATFNHDGKTYLNPSRLRTKSIRDRINVYTRATVFARGGIWFVADPGGGDAYPFVDNICVDDSGRPMFVAPEPGVSELPENGAIAALLAGALRDSMWRLHCEICVKGQTAGGLTVHEHDCQPEARAALKAFDAGA